MPTQRFEFPKDFVWGAATAAYQVEGAVRADGRGDSVWDAFCRVPGNIVDASSGEEACRHYQLWEQDLDLMQSLNLQAYRFSIAWPRVQPGGRGPANEKGLAFYERLVDGMLKRGIKPNATLYHWDLPTELEREGGWVNRDTALRFRDYAAMVAKRLGDRVDFWATFNEPGVFCYLGYDSGHHAPGRREGAKVNRQVIHHVLLAHGLAVRDALRPNLRRPGAKVGIVVAPAPLWPQDERPATLAAAEAQWERDNDWWMLPLTAGSYPERPWRELGWEVPEVRPGDMQTIAQPLDYVGVNYYTPSRLLADGARPDGQRRARALPGAPMADMPGWEIFAPALRGVLLNFHRRYGLPIYITENGMSRASDAPGPDGSVKDPYRLDYLRRHLVEVHRAMQEGADVRGYFHWSLMDNFEWGFGYTQRFGLVHVDYKTFKRTPKDSALWYRDFIKAGTLEADYAYVPYLGKDRLPAR